MKTDRSAARLYLLPTLAAAFLLRFVIVVMQLRRDPQEWFFNQATELARLGASLLAGQGLSSPFGGNTGPSAFLAPGYPAIVAAVFGMFGPYSRASATALLLLQVIFATLTVLVLMRVAAKLFGARVANVAGIVCAVSPPLLFLPTLFWETCLSTLLLTSFVSFAVCAAEQPRIRNWVALGASGAFAMLVNPSLTLALVALAVWSLWEARPGRWSAAIVVAAAWLLLFAPWPIRNVRAMHAFIPARSNLGYELWQGNRAGSNGAFSPELHPNVNREEFTRYARLGEVAYMREKSALATHEIDLHPARFAGVTLERIGKFWVGAGAHDPSPLILLYITLTSALGCVGLTLLFRRRRDVAWLFAGPLLLFPLPYYVTHPDFRFRLVLDPLMTLLAAYAVVCWRRDDAAHR